MRTLSGSLENELLSFDKVKIHYEIDKNLGQKYTLFFIHGMAGDLAAWDKERELFRTYGYRTLAMDLRGHGLSERPDREIEYDFSNIAEDVFGIIKKEHLVNTVLVGHCIGGMVCLLFEALHPKSAKAMVLVDTSYKPVFYSDIFRDFKFLRKILMLIAKHAPTKHINGYTDYAKIKFAPDISLIGFTKSLLHTSLKSYLYITEYLSEFSGLELLKKDRIPTLIISGNKDLIVPSQIAKELNLLIKDSELDIIDGGNHVVVLNNPVELTMAIKNFLDKSSHQEDKKHSSNRQANHFE